MSLTSGSAVISLEWVSQSSDGEDPFWSEALQSGFFTVFQISWKTFSSNLTLSVNDTELHLSLSQITTKCAQVEGGGGSVEWSVTWQFKSKLQTFCFQQNQLQFTTMLMLLLYVWYLTLVSFLDKDTLS